MRMEYWPGSNRLRGKLYSPCSLLATVTVIFEPVRLALTSTPSIAPSSCELTRPVSVAADELWAYVLPKEIPKITNTTIMNTQNRNLIMKSVSLNPMDSSFDRRDVSPHSL